MNVVVTYGTNEPRPPCAVCGTPYEKHGSYPTCASHHYSDGITPSAPTVSREATPASSGPDGHESAPLPASLPALLLQAVEALEEIANEATSSVEYGEWREMQAAVEKANEIAAALRQRIGRE